MSKKVNYFRECVGPDFAPKHFGLLEGTVPARVREALEKLAGTKEGDVLAALAWQHEMDRRRYARLLARYLEAKAHRGGPTAAPQADVAA